MNRTLTASMLATVVLLAGCLAGGDREERSATDRAPFFEKIDAAAADLDDSQTLHRGDLAGSGSTFVQALVEEWGTAYELRHPQLDIRYAGGGSGKGKSDILARNVSFAGTDAPLSDKELADAPGVLHIPVAAGGVAIVYNIPGLTELRLTAEALAGIYLGNITTWDDPAIARDNPSAKLPSANITVLRRADSSGTTATFTEYLDKTVPAWQNENGGPGAGSSITWPVGEGVKGGASLGWRVRETPHAIGYVGNEWSAANGVPTALIRNKAGEFVDATPRSVSAAVDEALASGAFDKRLRGSATDADGSEAYPISAVSWLLVNQDQPSEATARAVRDFLRFIIHDGQDLNLALKYTRIPPSLLEKADAAIDTIGSSGKPLAGGK